MSTEQNNPQKYYVPDQSIWPLVGSVALGLIAFGAAHFTIEYSNEQAGFGHWVLLAGLVVLCIMLVGWFGDQIRESRAGLYNAQLGRSYRQGMLWFIFSEVMFFLAFFGALFYARMIAVPWLGGAGNNEMTNQILWDGFQAIWPLTTTPGGTETQAMGWFGLPLINTIILVISSVTLHFAHVGLEEGKRKKLMNWLFVTIALGLIFLGLQMYEYVHAYRDLGLTLQSGIYGNTFFLLTGFHGLHVTLGAILLIVMFFRCKAGHFNKDDQFAFEASAWYWHFVDVVWICLFVFVYIL
ncbi:cytochrome c oxidase subunit 3 [Aliidiomarina halalkaliphila]|uniref:cytochrome-c oxidase n=1 Tax=Aliidiomarina halalkaliphila TaxID=2593535 RepID=A0A552X323_9GAMM|nr:cytochrome c oxidase subunit 3 [Aliidiomarina halalkaliphila]TRW49003.1 cytochrome c oxidase subunit 3 [Aliidiomarina halalkaliphila]